MEIINKVYVYCTDFIINLANITGLSYYEVNFIIFIILFPTLLVGSCIIYLTQIIRYRKLKNTI